MDAPVRHERPRRETKFMIGSHSQSSTGNVARVYPPRMLVSLMGCKRAEGIWRMDGRMGQRAVYRRKNRARKCAGPSEEKVLAHQSNKSLALLLLPAASSRGFFSLRIFRRARLFPPAQCKLRRELRCFSEYIPAAPT